MDDQSFDGLDIQVRTIGKFNEIHLVAVVSIISKIALYTNTVATFFGWDNQIIVASLEREIGLIEVGKADDIWSSCRAVIVVDSIFAKTFSEQISIATVASPERIVTCATD